MKARSAISNPLHRGLILFLFLGLSLGRSRAATSYAVSLEDPDKHLVVVQIFLPEGPGVRELQLPVWNALYEVRDFAQYVNWVHAKDRAGRPLSVYELDKSRWQITGAADCALLEYQMVVDSPAPFGAQLNSHHAFFNLAQILMYPTDARNEPLSVQAQEACLIVR